MVFQRVFRGTESHSSPATNLVRPEKTSGQIWNYVSLNSWISLCHLLSDSGSLWIGFLVDVEWHLKEQRANEMDLVSLSVSSPLYNLSLFVYVCRKILSPTFLLWVLTLMWLVWASGWRERTRPDLDASPHVPLASSASLRAGFHQLCVCICPLCCIQSDTVVDGQRLVRFYFGQ